MLSIVIAVIGSAGFWAVIGKKMDRKYDAEVRRNTKMDAYTAMLIGLAHDRIVTLGMEFIERGYITHDEYENLQEYLYLPYLALEGNGSAKRIMEEVSKLPIKKHYEKEYYET